MNDTPHASDCASWVGEPCDCITGLKGPYDEPTDYTGAQMAELNRKFGNRRNRG